MAISVVNVGTYSFSSSTDPCIITAPASIATGDMLWGYTTGRGGDGAYQQGEPRGTETDRWAYGNHFGYTGGNTGNRFNQHDGFWTRWNGVATPNLQVRNFSGDGVMVAWRGIEWMADFDQQRDFDDAAASTLTIPADDPAPNPITTGYGMELLYLHDYFRSDLGTHCTFDTSQVPSYFTLYCTYSRLNEYTLMYYRQLNPGDTIDALSIDYSGHTAAAFIGVSLHRLVSDDSMDESYDYDFDN